jgi:hypothetical protein
MKRITIEKVIESPISQQPQLVVDSPKVEISPNRPKSATLVATPPSVSNMNLYQSCSFYFLANTNNQ